MSAIEREVDSIAEIPRTCICTWHWSAIRRMWMRTKAEDNCPWHQNRRPAQ